MKITDEMETAGARALWKTLGVSLTEARRITAVVLDVVLADPRSPVSDLDQRLAAAEAKLAKVRACAQIHGSSDCGEEILAILDR